MSSAWRADIKGVLVTAVPVWLDLPCTHARQAGVAAAQA
jgi:hypothetical protein